MVTAAKNVTWGPDERFKVACGMVPGLRAGRSKAHAFIEAQPVLPPERRRKPHNAARDALRLAPELLKALRMTDEQRAAVLSGTVPAPIESKPSRKKDKPVKVKAKVKVARRRKLAPIPEAIERAFKIAADGKRRPLTLVIWTDREIALVARRIAHYQRELHDTRALSRLVKLAQAIELPPERRRTEKSIGASMASIQKALVRGYVLAHELLGNEPFDRDRTEYVAPKAEEPADAPTVVHEFIEPAAPTEHLTVKGPAIESPVVNIDGPRKRRAEPAPAETAVEAPAAIAAPIPLPTPQKPPSEPARRFGEAFADGMAELMRSMTLQMVTELEERLTAMSERLMGKAVETLGRGVASMVHSALEKELGGPVAEPAQDDRQPGLFELPESAGHELLKIDVVGLNGALAAEIRKTLNGHAAGVRFIEQDKIDSWSPRRDAFVVLNTKFSSHSADRKCIAAGVKPMRIQGGSGAIINAIRQLYAEEGVPLPIAH